MASVLNHKPSKPYWDIPGGRITEGHSVTETLAREIEEEIGVVKTEGSKFFTAVVSNHEIPMENRTVGLVLMIYMVRIPRDSEIRLSEEHVAYEWVDKREAARRLADKYPQEFTSKLM